MPEWLDTDTSEGGAFDHTGNFTEDRRQSRSFDEDNHVNAAVDHVITDRPGSGGSPKENSLEKLGSHIHRMFEKMIHKQL